MKVVLEITKKLTNALDYYSETKDVDDLVLDIEKIIIDLTIGDI